MKFSTILLLPSCLFPLPSLAQGPTTLGASSIITPGSFGDLILRRTAHRKGDVLTILVNEVMQGQYAASTTTSKAVAASTDKVGLPIVDVFAGPVLGQILGKGASLPRKIVNGLLGPSTVGGKESSDGSGTATTKNQFSATLSVIVTEVDAGGNLHVEGSRLVRVNKETQKMTLTGTVRQDDVAPDNTVPSEKVANADIKADGKGAVADKTRRSFLGKILDWLY